MCGPTSRGLSSSCKVRMMGKVNVDSGSDEPVSWRWSSGTVAPLEKALVVEKEMNRESDEQDQITSRSRPRNHM